MYVMQFRHDVSLSRPALDVTLGASAHVGDNVRATINQPASCK